MFNVVTFLSILAQAKKGQGTPPLKMPHATIYATVITEQLIKFRHDENSLEKHRKLK